MALARRSRALNPLASEPDRRRATDGADAESDGRAEGEDGTGRRAILGAAETDAAISAYEEMEKKYNKRAEVAHRLAVLYTKKGDFPQADQYFELALEARPQERRNPLRIWVTVTTSAASMRRPETYTRKSLERNSRLARAHNNLALVLVHSNRQEAALTELAKAGCKEPQARVNLAYALMWDQQWQAAEQQLTTALTADPASQQAADGLAQLHKFQVRRQVAAAAPVMAPSSMAACLLRTTHPAPARWLPRRYRNRRLRPRPSSPAATRCGRCNFAGRNTDDRPATCSDVV